MNGYKNELPVKDGFYWAFDPLHIKKEIVCVSTRQQPYAKLERRISHIGIRDTFGEWRYSDWLFNHDPINPP